MVRISPRLDAGMTDWLPGLIGMQINMPDSGTFLFISDHCHVIENASSPSPGGCSADSCPSGVTAFPKAGLQETIQHGSEAPKD